MKHNAAVVTAVLLYRENLETNIAPGLHYLEIVTLTRVHIEALIFPQCHVCSLNLIDRSRKYMAVPRAGIKSTAPVHENVLVGLAGFEPTTSCPPDKRANQAAPQPE